MGDLTRKGVVILLLLLNMAFDFTYQQQTLTRCRTALDIVIAVDGSNSMGQQNFRIELNSVTNVIDNLDVSENNVHVGALLYSLEVETPVIPISPNKQQVISGILSWPYPDQETRTDLAINAARDMFLRDGRGPEVPQVLIVVTDGASTVPSLTLSEANAAKAQGIEIFAVGVTGPRNEVDRSELEQIASSPNNVLITQDFTTLEQALNQAAEQICIDLECGDALIDMVFMLDNSATVGVTNFDDIKNFVVEFLYFAHVYTSNIRVGVMSFSNTPSVAFNMIRYNGDETGMNNAIRAIPYRGGGTNIADALTVVRESMYTAANGDRVAAPDVVIFVSGSLANLDQMQTSTEAQATRAAGIQIYGVGVGLPSTQDLDTVVSQPPDQNRFLTGSYNQILGVIEPFYENFNRFCADPPPVPACYMGDTDIWYVVEQSVTAEAMSRVSMVNDFGSLKNGLIEQINIVLDPSVANPGVRMGLVTYSDQFQRLVSTTDSSSASRTAQSVNSIPGFIPVGGSNLLSALQQITMPPQISQWNSYVALVTPQSAFNNYSPIQSELNRLRQLGYVIVLFTVRTAAVTQQAQVQALASAPQYAYFLNDYVSLEDGTKNFTRDILCAPPPPVVITQPPVVITTPPPITNGLCAPTRYRVDGMDVTTYPGECNKYIQCYYDAANNLDVAIVRYCPRGLYWNQNFRVCTPANETICVYDKCSEDCDPYPMDNTCSGYWQCVDGQSVAMCCESGYAFVPDKGCVEDHSCTDPCYVEEWCGLCVKRTNYENEYGYDVLTTTSTMNTGAMWSPRHCDYSYFDIVTCDCTTDFNSVCPSDRSYNFRDSLLLQQAEQGLIDGIRIKDVTYTGTAVAVGTTSEIHVDVNKREDGAPWSVVLRYTEGQAINPYGEVIMTSGMNCGAQNGIVVNADAANIYAHVYEDGVRTTTLSVPYQGISPNEFKTLGLSYYDGMLTLWIKGLYQQYIAQAAAPSDICLSCGIDIGGALNMQSFTGQVESVAVYSCAVQPFDE